MSSDESNTTEACIDSEVDLTASQAAPEYYKLIREKYGRMPKDIFVTELSTKYTVEELCHYRQGVYDLSLKERPNTPRGHLIVRKDTRNIGGKTIETKLSEDIFTIYQYIEGDLSLNIIDILSVRSRKTLNDVSKRTTENFCATKLSNTPVRPTATRDNRNTEMDAATDTPEWPIMDNNRESGLMKFCANVLVEMRKDRDILLKEMNKLT